MNHPLSTIGAEPSPISATIISKKWIFAALGITALALFLKNRKANQKEERISYRRNERLDRIHELSKAIGKPSFEFISSDEEPDDVYATNPLLTEEEKRHLIPHYRPKTKPKNKDYSDEEILAAAKDKSLVDAAKSLDVSYKTIQTRLRLIDLRSERVFSLDVLGALIDAWSKNKNKALKIKKDEVLLSDFSPINIFQVWYNVGTGIATVKAKVNSNIYDVQEEVFPQYKSQHVSEILLKESEQTKKERLPKTKKPATQLVKEWKDKHKPELQTKFEEKYPPKYKQGELEGIIESEEIEDENESEETDSEWLQGVEE